MQTLLRSIVPHVARKCCTLNIEKKLSHHFYCSAECKSSWISENQSGENHIQWSRVLVECSYCGREIYVTKRKSKKTKISFVRASIRDCGCLTTILVKIVQYI